MLHLVGEKNRADRTARRCAMSMVVKSLISQFLFNFATPAPSKNWYEQASSSFLPSNSCLENIYIFTVHPNQTGNKYYKSYLGTLKIFLVLLRCNFAKACWESIGISFNSSRPILQIFRKLKRNRIWVFHSSWKSSSSWAGVFGSDYENWLDFQQCRPSGCQL